MPQPSVMTNIPVADDAPITGLPNQERLHMRWEERMGFQSRGIRHKKTSVLLLSWEGRHDDLGVGEEVVRLQGVFERDYGFKVYNKTVNMLKKPGHQALNHLSNFVLEEDAEQALLIIYYAGHGWRDTSRVGNINLTGNLRPPTESDREPEEELLKKRTIVWSEVEPAIKSTDADVLLIFDCCEAGVLCRPHRTVKRSYFEFLGACSVGQTTRGPGPESFTRALTAALKSLAKKQAPFSTSELLHAIREHKDFPNDQIPVLSDRYMPGEHIVISRMDLESSSIAPAPSMREREKRQYIDLRFYFDGEIPEQHFDDTADALKSMEGWEKVHWNRVAFREQSSIVEKSAMWWKEFTSRKKSISNASAQPPTSPEILVISPDMYRIPALPDTPAASADASKACSLGPETESTPLLVGSHQNQMTPDEEDSVWFHVRAIAKKSQICSMFGCARKRKSRSRYEHPEP